MGGVDHRRLEGRRVGAERHGVVGGLAAGEQLGEAPDELGARAGDRQAAGEAVHQTEECVVIAHRPGVESVDEPRDGAGRFVRQSDRAQARRVRQPDGPICDECRRVGATTGEHGVEVGGRNDLVKALSV